VLRRLAARETRNPFPRTFLSPSPRVHSVKIFFGRCERAQSTIIESRDGVPRCVKMGNNERGEGIIVPRDRRGNILAASRAP